MKSLWRLTPVLLCLYFSGAACAQQPADVRSLVAQARELARQGDADAAIGQLQQAAEAGYTGFVELTTRPEFSGLQDDSRFQAVVATVRARAYPCENSASHRQFDFWAGSWDVYDRNDNKAGQNTIRIVENGCVLEELWTSARGGTGRSLNFYNADTARWVQNWVSADGLIINIEGGIDEHGAMVMSGTSYYTASGAKNPFRGSWTLLEDGRVRQFFEESYDGGETWTPWFEGFYVRRDQGDDQK